MGGRYLVVKLIFLFLTSCLLHLTSFSRTPTSDLFSKLFVVGERDTKTFYSSTGKRSKVLRTFWGLFRRFEVFIRDMEIARPKKAYLTAKKRARNQEQRQKTTKPFKLFKLFKLFNSHFQIWFWIFCGLINKWEGDIRLDIALPLGVDCRKPVS